MCKSLCNTALCYIDPLFAKPVKQNGFCQNGWVFVEGYILIAEKNRSGVRLDYSKPANNTWVHFLENMLSSGKRSVSKEDIRTADKDEKVSIPHRRIGKHQRDTQRSRMMSCLAGNLMYVWIVVLQESLLEHDSDLDEEMLFT